MGIGLVFPINSVWALLFWLAVGTLLVASFVRARASLRRRRSTALDDDDVRKILETGTFDLEDELDLTEIEEEERKFWAEEDWDEANEW